MGNSGRRGDVSDINTATRVAARALDEVDASVAVLDQEGVIVLTNRAWRDFARRNPMADGSLPRNVGIGTNYLQICQRAKGSSSENSALILEGICSVIDGRAKEFRHEYPCHSPERPRWFSMKVKAIRYLSPRLVIVMHRDMTDRWIAERKAAAKQQELSTALAQLQAMAESIRESASKFATPWPESRPESLSTSGVSTKQDRQIGERLSLLSRRELQIMEGLLRGERNADMAIRLNLSRKSISTYRSRVLEKLRVANNAQLVAAVHAHRITGHTK